MKNKAKQAFLAVVTALGAGTVTAQTLAQPGEDCPVRASAHEIYSKDFERARNACITTNFSERTQRRCIEIAEYDYNTKIANHPNPEVPQYCVSADFHLRSTMPLPPVSGGVVIAPLPSAPTVVLTPNGTYELQNGPNYQQQHNPNDPADLYPRQDNRPYQGRDYRDRDHRGRDGGYRQRDDDRRYHHDGNNSQYTTPAPSTPPDLYPRPNLVPVPKKK